MKKIILYTLSFFIFSSCSSEKTLSIKKSKYNWYINDVASQDNGKLRPYNLHKSLKNSPVQNQLEVQASFPTAKNKQDFLATKDKIESAVLTNNYSHKKLTQVIQNEKINKSFNEKLQIFEKIKDKKNKVLRIIGTSLLIVLTLIIYSFSHLILFFNSGYGANHIINIFVVLLSTLFTYLSYKAVKNTIKAFSKGSDNKDDVKESNSKDNNKDDKMKKLLLLLLFLFPITLLG